MITAGTVTSIQYRTPFKSFTVILHRNLTEEHRQRNLRKAAFDTVPELMVISAELSEKCAKHDFHRFLSQETVNLRFLHFKAIFSHKVHIFW